MINSLLLASLLVFLRVPGTVQGPHEERLIESIFQSRKYQALSRPVANEGSAVNVSFGISLQQIIDVDEKNENIHTNMWLNYEWKDYKLSWNKSDYGGVESIRLPSTMIWTPDILLYNSADEDIDSKYPTNIVVLSDGTCSWIPLGLFISTCAIDIRWFPFDDQFCRMKFGSWSYDQSKINLTAKDHTVDLTTYQPSGEWDLVEVLAIRNEQKYDCCPEPYIDVTFTIHIRRRTLYYGFNLIIPYSLISMLTLLTFILPPGEGEKIGLGITILLSLSVFQLIVADMVPATSMAVPIVGVYFGCVTIMCTLSVIMTVLVLNYHHRTPDMYVMPLWVRLVICEWLAWFLRISRPGHDFSPASRKRQARLRLLQETNPPSPSLIANICNGGDSSNGHSYIQMFRSAKHQHQQPAAAEGQATDQMATLQTTMLSVLNELRYLTNKLKADDEQNEKSNDWKFAAMVIDRLCFWICTVYLVLVTLAVFLSPTTPKSIETSDF